MFWARSCMFSTLWDLHLHTWCRFCQLCSFVATSSSVCRTHFRSFSLAGVLWCIKTSDICRCAPGLWKPCQETPAYRVSILVYRKTRWIASLELPLDHISRLWKWSLGTCRILCRMASHIMLLCVQMIYVHNCYNLIFSLLTALGWWLLKLYSVDFIESCEWKCKPETGSWTIH